MDFGDYAWIVTGFSTGFSGWITARYINLKKQRVKITNQLRGDYDDVVQTLEAQNIKLGKALTALQKEEHKKNACKADAFMLAKHVLGNADLGAKGLLLARNKKGQIAKYTVLSVVKNLAKQVVENDAK